MSKVPVKDRERKVDINAMSDEERDALQKRFSDMVNDKLGGSITEINKVFSVYGLKIDVLYEINPLGTTPPWHRVDWFVENLELLREGIKAKSAAEEEKSKKKESKPAKKPTKAAKKPAVRKPRKKAAQKPKTSSKRSAKKSSSNTGDGKIES